MKYVFTRPGSETTPSKPQKIKYLVTLVFGMALCDKERPLADVLRKRFAFEEEEEIMPVIVWIAVYREQMQSS